jgi:hypothetical protein
VHRCHERNGNIFQLQAALREVGIVVYGTEATTVMLAAPEAPSLRHEYGTLELTVDLVENMQEAIEKIHTLGSGHTEVRPEAAVLCTTALRGAEPDLLIVLEPVLEAGTCAVAMVQVEASALPIHKDASGLPCGWLACRSSAQQTM